MIPVTMRYKTYGFYHPISEITVSNFAEIMDIFLSVVFVECYAGSARCDGLITHAENSFRVLVCLIVCVI